MTRNAWLVVALGCATLVPSAQAQLTVKSEDGRNSIKLGLLAQQRAEWFETADGSGTTQDLYLRRLRVLLGGKIGERLSFFVETDSPNLGKAAADGKKNDGDVFLQDAFVSYTFRPAIILDGGMMLTPNSHNTQQSAASLVTIDYSPYSFLHSGPTGSRGGRDYGLQARGYLLKNHFEYRLGVFQGVRGSNSTNGFRTVARAVYYPLEADTGFFYSGTNFGKKRIVAVGASYDRQDQYRTAGLDAFANIPLGKGALTIQGDVLAYDGGEFLAQLPKQNTYLLEASYFISGLKLEPFVQFARRDFKPAGMADEQAFQIGVAFWEAGHQFNLKLAWGRWKKDGAPDRNQLTLQSQLFVF